MTIEVHCPAKLNLFLSVGPRDLRGYHPLRTVFQAISLVDSLTITVANEDRFTCDDPTIPIENTVTRVWRLLREIAPLPALHVHLTKAIPTESGLGGGSSDAAGFIRAIEKLVGRLPSEAERMAVASAVGADVPFFLVGGAAKAEGYGEKLTALPDSTPKYFVVACPAIGCATGAMYSKLDTLDYSWRDFPSAGEQEAYNDFERVCPGECLDLIEKLHATGASEAGLSGSGSAVWARFDAPDKAQAVADQLKQLTSTMAWTVRSLTRAESLGVQIPAH